ncbi:geranylgeranyl reductase family protein [Desulfosporosinus sp. FKB]|uniref:geranylgeranyl reductase family protein n=1 Tax=Desulfosporosinus sp. FKB TaxID=1969835 RepID=UPI000B4A31D7|nr:geranylgeranyl reductase family protein [Desulfosporosinus sp. FKB]
MTSKHYDVVIVGAGPAGASAAQAAAKSGINVLLIDAGSHPERPVQCAEFVPREINQYVQLAPGAVVQTIRSMDIYLYGKPVASLAGSGYLLNREVFDKSLVNRAVAAGAEFRTGTRATAKTDSGLMISRNGKEEFIQTSIIIGADGPRSAVGHWIKSENREYLAGFQYTLSLRDEQKSIDLYFKPEYTGGYAWLFPKGDRANVGVGVSLLHKEKLPHLLQQFVNDLTAQGKIKDTLPSAKTGGLIPVGGPLGITQAENVLLCGDAGGFTHPVTGGGILTAIVTGEIAGRCAAQAVINHDLRLLSRYPQQWQSILGGFLERARRKRNDMTTYWTEDRDQFEGLIKRTWIGAS